MSILVPPRAGMTLSFADEFDRISLNSDGSPGWLTTFPWGGRILTEFDQRQLYVDADYVTQSGVTPGIDPFSINNGVLSITADLTPPQPFGGIKQAYTSGHINSAGTFDFRYGYVEARLQVPAGQGFLSTFWMLRTDKAALGEIDVLEYLGFLPKTLFGTVHYTEEGEISTKDKVVRAAVDDLSLDFHTYAVDWTPVSISFYLDGVLMGVTPTTEPLKAPMYMIADLSVGGVWAGYPDSTTPFPSEYKIDYIRVWQDQSYFTPETNFGKASSETMSGGEGNDILSGSFGDDTILGAGGNDFIHGDGGNDRLQGNRGNDTLMGDGGNNTLEGGAGDDAFVQSIGDTLVEFSGGGFDTVFVDRASYSPPGNVEGLIYTGSADFRGVGNGTDNRIIGGQGNDTLVGGAGNDTLFGMGGNDKIQGGIGDDIVVSDGGNDTLTGDVGADIFAFIPTSGTSNVVVTDFQVATDRLDLRAFGIYTVADLKAAWVANASDNLVLSKLGTTITFNNAKLANVTQSNLISAGLAMPGAPTGATLSQNRVAENASVGTVVGTLIQDDVTAPFKYTLLNGAGVFTLDGSRIIVANGLDFETQTNHTLNVRMTNAFGQFVDKSYVINIDNVNEAPFGVALSKTTVATDASGGAIVGALSASDPDAGDTLSYKLINNGGGNFALSGASLVVVGALDPQDYTLTVRATDKGGLFTEQNFIVTAFGPPPQPGVLITGTAGNDIISKTQTVLGQSFAGTGADTLIGNAGNDRLEGGVGHDSLDGGVGADTLIGGLGRDTLSGGAGLDVASYANAAFSIALDMADGNWVGALGDAAGDVLIGIESVEGSAYNDTVYGTSLGDRLNGLAGNDLLDGRSGHDSIMGGDGDDTIIGGFGNDSLNGQAGNDLFVFYAGSGQDLIAGFAAGKAVGDVIGFQGQFNSFDQVFASATDRTGVTSPVGTAFTGVVITSGTDEIWIANVSKSMLNANDFVFA